nr:hypothetical protein [Bacteroidota bacterium]
MKRSIFLFLGLLTVAATFAQKNMRYEIPFTIDRNLIVIEAQIAGNATQSFIFDTGTEGIMILDSIAKLYSFKFVGLDTIVNEKEEFVGAQPKVLIPDLYFAGLKLENKEAATMPAEMLFTNKAVGIIGMQTFAGFMITLDYKNSKIILQEGSLLQQPNVIKINLDHLLEAKVKVNNKEVLAHFDCGGAGYISIPKSWDSIYKLKVEPVFLTKGRTPMGDFDVFKTELDGDIEVGTYKISNPKINLVTGDFFFSVNFGYGFFKEHLITIDTKNKLMLIEQ